MGMLKENIQDRIRDYFRIRTLPRKRLLRRFMGLMRLVLADVGATGNPKGIWREASEFITPILFDPDPRASIQSSKDSSLVFASGLWSGKASKTLSLAVNPEASSVYKFNENLTEDFLNSPLHKVVSQQQISLNSMENVLAATGYQPDFIKVDAEGADLEILKGAGKYLQTSCLGVFAEVSFAERHKGAPFFTDVDIYMRTHNFMLMDLFLERWIRTNAIKNLFSRHQVIWGNALFVLNRQEFLRRLRGAESGAAKDMFMKFLFILLLYQLHDYADEIVKYSESERLINEEEATEARRLIDSAIANGPANIVRLLMAIVISSVGVVLFIPLQRVWRDNLLFLKIQFGELGTVVLRFSTRRYKGCVVDPADPSSRI